MKTTSSHYPHFPSRTVHDLGGFWDLAVLGDTDPDAVDLASLAFTRTMAVPGVYDTQVDLAGMRGLVAVRRRVSTTPGMPGRLQFDGLGLWARVFVDGQALGDCHLPYCPWSVEVPAAESATREVIILIDNRFGPERALLFDNYFDWYAHGGIYRQVQWHEIPATAFDRVVITPLDLETGRVRLEARFHAAPGEVALRLAWDDAVLGEQETVAVTHGCAQWEVCIPQAQVWSPEHPHLHRLRCELADGSDAIVERCGLRTVRAEAGKILLNEKSITLHGVNRHELHPLNGPALDNGQIAHDLSILKDLGVNFVRGSHYQQDPRFLDLCDEHGILVWEESLGWQARAHHFENPRFVDLHEEQVRRMVQSSINHPAIFCWAILNEGDSFEENSRPVYERLAKAIKDEDESRLLTYACCHPFRCINLDLCDLIGINLYPGWYPEDRANPHPTGEIEPALDKVLEHLKEQGLDDRPMILSEIGAGALYGCRDSFRSHWSEEYQQDYLEELCRYYQHQPEWQGLCIWQFCDGRTKNGGMALVRPRGFNNKGLLDEYRRPKLAYGAVKRCFQEWGAGAPSS